MTRIVHTPQLPQFGTDSLSTKFMIIFNLGIENLVGGTSKAAVFGFLIPNGVIVQRILSYNEQFHIHRQCISKSYIIPPIFTWYLSK